MTIEEAIDGLTMGVEEEFQLVDPDSADLVSDVDALLDAAPVKLRDHLHPELHRSMVETATPVCADIDELRTAVTELRSLLADVAQERGVGIAAAGTHPFARYEDQKMTDKPRYRALMEDMRWALKRDLVFGQHVHVGVPDGEATVVVTNEIRAFLPLLLALSVNAPFWRGMDTGLDSVRVRVFEALPRSGLPRAFEDLADLERAFDALKQAGAVEDWTRIWWDVRPRPDFGTVETRIQDVSTDVETSIALAGLTQALVARILRGHQSGQRPPLVRIPEVIEENRWRAMRDGLDARFIHVDTQGEIAQMPVREALARTVEDLEPEIDALGLGQEIGHLERLAGSGTSGATRQREVYKRTGELRSVTRDVVDRTEP